MNDRREIQSTDDHFSPQFATVTPVADSQAESLAAVLASPQAMTLIGGLTKRFRSLGVRPPRYPQELDSCVAGESWLSDAAKDRNLLFSVAHHSCMDMLADEGCQKFNRSRDVAEISGVALLEREGERSGGGERLWFLLQSVAGHLASQWDGEKADCRLDFRHSKGFNWVFDGTRTSAILTSTCFRIRYAGLTRAEVSQMIVDAVVALGTLNRGERLSLHRCFHA